MRDHHTVNGTEHEVDDVWPGESLLYVLRERMGLPGSKNACEQGECGSCTVYLDGEPVCACLVAAGQAQGREVVTVEGLADGEASCTRCSRRSSRPAPSSAGSARPGSSSPRTTCWTACRGPSRPGDPRGAGRQPVPLHRLREDPRRRPPGRRAAGDAHDQPTTAPRRPPRPRHRRPAASATARSARTARSRSPASSPTPATCGTTRWCWGVDAAQPAPARPHPGRSTSPRRSPCPGVWARAHRRRRAGGERLRPRARRPAGARLGVRPLRGRAGRARGRRPPGDRPPGRRADRRRLRGAAGRHRPPPAPWTTTPRRCTGRGNLVRHLQAPPRRGRTHRAGRRLPRLRGRHAGPGLPRPGVRARRPGRGRRRRPLRRHPVAARRPAADLPGARHAAPRRCG